MTLPPPPPLEELRSALVPALERFFAGNGEVQILGRTPMDYATSSPSDIVTCRVGLGHIISVRCKYGGPSDHVVHGHRAGTAGEAITYKEVLVPLGVRRPAFYGSYLDESSGETWLFLEYLERAERVSRTADPAAMPAAARWLGQFHARAEQRLRSGFNPPLSHYDREYFMGWASRTSLFARPHRERYRWLEAACVQFEEAMEVLDKAPATVIHGEFYGYNLLWDEGAVVPIDWESAAISAGEIDLASLLERWSPDVVEACEAAYADARWPVGAPTSLAKTLHAARYYMALRWLGDFPEETLNKSSERRFTELERLAREWRSRSVP